MNRFLKFLENSRRLESQINPSGNFVGGGGGGAGGSNATPNSGGDNFLEFIDQQRDRSISTFTEIQQNIFLTHKERALSDNNIIDKSTNTSCHLSNNKDEGSGGFHIKLIPVDLERDSKLSSKEQLRIASQKKMRPHQIDFDVEQGVSATYALSKMYNSPPQVKHLKS